MDDEVDDVLQRLTPQSVRGPCTEQMHADSPGGVQNEPASPPEESLPGTPPGAAECAPDRDAEGGAWSLANVRRWRLLALHRNAPQRDSGRAILHTITRLLPRSLSKT